MKESSQKPEERESSPEFSKEDFKTFLQIKLEKVKRNILKAHSSNRSDLLRNLKTMVAVGYDNALIDHLVDNQKEIKKDFPLLLPHNLKAIDLKKKEEASSA